MLLLDFVYLAYFSRDHSRVGPVLMNLPKNLYGFLVHDFHRPSIMHSNVITFKLETSFVWDKQSFRAGIHLVHKIRLLPETKAAVEEQWHQLSPASRIVQWRCQHWWVSSTQSPSVTLQCTWNFTCKRDNKSEYPAICYTERHSNGQLSNTAVLATVLLKILQY